MSLLKKLERRQLGNILAAALEGGGEFADIFLEEKTGTSISLEDNKVERITSGVDCGAGIRVVAGEATAYAYTNDLSYENLLELARQVGRVFPQKKGEWNLTYNLRPPVLDEKVVLRPDDVPMEDKVEMVERANREARKAGDKVKQVMAGYGDAVQRVVICNSEGTYVEDERIRTRLVVNVVASADGVIQTGYASTGGTKGFELLEEEKPEDLAQEAAGRALLMLTAKPAPAGKMPVVMAGEAGGTMVHEACGHGLEADLVQKGLSVYAGRKGEEVASPLITVVDDATLPGKYGSLRYDDEGVPGQKTVLIEKGVLVNFMYDLVTARKDGVAPTGNGRRESYAHKPIPRMRNTYIAPGKEDPEKIIRDTKKGLLVKKMGGGQVNTTNGDFVFDVAEAYLIENGEVTVPVRGATLTGNGPEVLRMVERVGKDLGFTIGVCGKDGQGAPVSDAQPTMYIRELLVGGTSFSGRGEKRLEKRKTGIRRL
ncbi:MAG: TldD protein [Eubacteriales bacterium]|nr:TldD protein [Eubacteriales bacterium]MDN5364538.1 TldD protein [Eubacteriales bacterium]